MAHVVTVHYNNFATAHDYNYWRVGIYLRPFSNFVELVKRSQYWIAVWQGLACIYVTILCTEPSTRPLQYRHQLYSLQSSPWHFSTPTLQCHQHHHNLSNTGSTLPAPRLLKLSQRPQKITTSLFLTNSHWLPPPLRQFQYITRGFCIVGSPSSVGKSKSLFRQIVWIGRSRTCVRQLEKEKDRFSQ